MPEKEIEGETGKTFGESTKIKLNVKTLMYILGGLVVLFTYFYIDMKMKLKEANNTISEKVQEEVKKYKDDMSDVKTTVRDIRNVQMQNSINIGILLDRSTGNRTSGTSNLTPEENIPENIFSNDTIN